MDLYHFFIEFHVVLWRPLVERGARGVMGQSLLKNCFPPFTDEIQRVLGQRRLE